MMRWLLALVLLMAVTPAHAQRPPLEHRADTIVTLLRDGKVDQTAFSPAFLAEVPADRLVEVATQLRTANGAVLGIASLKPHDATQADVVIDFEQARVTVQYAIESAPPQRFIGVLITNVARKGDSFDGISAELASLPGKASFAVVRLGGPAPAVIAAHNADQALATGSTFKLYVLAALAEKVATGQRRWADVVPLGAPSFPSGISQDWPAGTPMTLQALATLMISISDNTATDTLMTTLGRRDIDAVRESIGTTQGRVPMLTTLEAFSLKTASRAALRARWTAGGREDRRQVINEIEPSVAAIDRRELGNGPAFIDTVEWPATVGDTVSVLDRLRKTASPPVLTILAVNPALAPDQLQRFAYAGYKGGSEAGVIAQSWLLQTKSGDWYAVAGAWNNPAAAVDDNRFAALMARAVALVGR